MNRFTILAFGKGTGKFNYMYSMDSSKVSRLYKSLLVKVMVLFPLIAWGQPDPPPGGPGGGDPPVGGSPLDGGPGLLILFALVYAFFIALRVYRRHLAKQDHLL